MDLSICNATSDDCFPIADLIYSVDGDITDNLSWRQFTVAMDHDVVIGCGRLKDFGHFQEVASIAVCEKYRKQNVGSHIVGMLINKTNKPVYLTCEDKTIYFFTQLGFVVTKKIPVELEPKLEKYPSAKNVMVLNR